MHGTVSVCVWWGCCCTLLIVFRDVVIVSVRLTQLSFPASSVRRSVWFPKMKLCEISRSLYKKLRVFLIAFFRVDALHTFVGNVRLFHLAGVHVWIRSRRWEEVYFVLCFFFYLRRHVCSLWWMCEWREAYPSLQGCNLSCSYRKTLCHLTSLNISEPFFPVHLLVYICPFDLFIRIKKMKPSSHENISQ